MILLQQHIAHFNDGYWCIHLTIVDHSSGGRWIPLEIEYDEDLVKIILIGLIIYAWWLLGNDFRCQRSIYDF